MPDIDVRSEGGSAGRSYTVRLVDEGGETEHLVTLSPEDFERLGEGHVSPEEFVRACFEFLLEREPKESILPRFDVSVISRYFPEFEEAIRR